MAYADHTVKCLCGEEVEMSEYQRPTLPQGLRWANEINYRGFCKKCKEEIYEYKE